MSSSIASVTIGTAESRLILSNSQAARIMSVGSNWTKLRIGMRIGVGDAGVNLTGTPRLYIGTLSAPTVNLSNGPLGAATSNFFGMASRISTWFRNAAAGAVSYESSDMFGSAVKVGASLTTNNPGVPARITNSPATKRNILILLLDKGTDGNADWKVGVVWRSASVASNIDTSYQNLVNAMEASPAEPVLATRLQAMADVINLEVGVSNLYVPITLSSTVTVNEATNGGLNAICVAWDRTTVPFYFSEVIFAKQS